MNSADAPRSDGMVFRRRAAASVVPGAPSTATRSGLPVHRRPAHLSRHGEQITRDALRVIGPGGGRAGR